MIAQSWAEGLTLLERTDLKVLEAYRCNHVPLKKRGTCRKQLIPVTRSTTTTPQSMVTDELINATLTLSFHETVTESFHLYVPECLAF